VEFLSSDEHARGRGSSSAYNWRAVRLHILIANWSLKLSVLTGVQEI
jgi:hypothetical protein